MEILGVQVGDLRSSDMRKDQGKLRYCKNPSILGGQFKAYITPLRRVFKNFIHYYYFFKWQRQYACIPGYI